MLEHLPAWLGEAMQGLRAGHEKLVVARSDLALGKTRIKLSSPAFAHGARLPERFTADGAGASPPLLWSGVPPETHALALIVEDPDAPAPRPFVHAIVWNIPPGETGLGEGAIVKDGNGQADGRDVGRSSFGEGWLPPDPPPGHGGHDYVFQLFALAEGPALESNPGRTALIEAIRDRVLGAGILVGTYSRDENESAGLFGRPVASA